MQQEHAPVVVHECTLTVYQVVLGSEGGVVMVVVLVMLVGVCCGGGYWWCCAMFVGGVPGLL